MRVRSCALLALVTACTTEAFVPSLHDAGGGGGTDASAPPVDADVDTGPRGPTYCDQQANRGDAGPPDLCLDYDEGTLDGSPPLTNVLSGNATMSIDTKLEARSPPGSFLASWFGAQTGWAYQVKTFAGAYRSQRMAIDVRLDAPKITAELFGLEQRGGTNGRFGIRFLANQGNLAVAEFGANPSVGIVLVPAAAVPLPVGVWFRVVLDLTFAFSTDGGVATGTVKVKIDGVDKLTSALAGPAFAPTTCDVDVGLGKVDGTEPAGTVHLDDVIVDVTK